MRAGQGIAGLTIAIQSKVASQVAKPDGLVVVDPDTELDFLHDLPVELMWGVGPVTKTRLAEIGVRTIGQLAKTPGWSLERLLGPAAGERLAALAWNRDPREIKTQRGHDRPELSRRLARSQLSRGSSDLRYAISLTGSVPGFGPNPWPVGRSRFAFALPISTRSPAP
jgi:nucleotidyltransferase/DNA polymerase involved in DNA repair